MVRRLFPLIVAALVVCPAAATRAPQGLSTQTGEQVIRQLKVPLPLVDSSVCRAVGMWAALAGVPFGVECDRSASGSHLASPEKSRVETMLNLSGLRFDAALETLLQHTAESQYDAHAKAGYVVVRRKAAPAEEPALDRKVPRFVLDNANLVQAGQQIRRIFTPDYVANAERLYGRDRPLSAAGREEPEVVRKFREAYNRQFSEVRSLDLTNASVEDILIAVSRLYGEYSWMVQYSPGNRRFEDAVLEFVGVGKQPVSFAPARPVARTRTP